MSDGLGRKLVVVEEKYCYEKEETELTVQKTSRFSQGDGFIVYDNKGDIIFRVDSYGPLNQHHNHHNLVLMDPVGHPLVTLLPKRPTLHHQWEGFLGEKSDGQHQQPIFSIWRSMIIGRSNVIVEVYTSDPPVEYQIEGSFSERRCTISRVGTDHDTSKVLTAQIKRKEDPTKHIVFGRDVFSLILKAGFDGAFAMALVLALDRIDGDDDVACC